MSIATTQATAVTTPSSKRLQRLVVAAGAYLGKDVGDTIPVKEVRLQAEENGYTDNEIRAMLEADGLSSADEIQVPEQGHLFGELWACGVPSPSTPSDTISERLETFRKWCEERAANEKSHTYTFKTAKRRYAKAKDVDRYFIKEYDTFSTVLITYDAGEPIDESVAEHSKRFYPRAVVRMRRNILKKLGAYNEYAGVTVLAPKKGSRVPHPNAPSGYSHAHTFLWIPGEVSAEAFHPLIERHIARVEGATEADHPLYKAVTVEVHESAEVQTPDSVIAQGSGLDIERGATTALPQEVGRNLPLQNCQFDARGAPTYIEKWCACLRLGTDQLLTTRGLSRFQNLGSFKEYADEVRLRRRLELGAKTANRLETSLVGAIGDGTQGN